MKLLDWMKRIADVRSVQYSPGLVDIDDDLLESAREDHPPTASPAARSEHPTPPPWRDLFRDLTGMDLTRCRVCGRGTIIRHRLPSASLYPPPDTS